MFFVNTIYTTTLPKESGKMKVDFRATKVYVRTKMGRFKREPPARVPIRKTVHRTVFPPPPALFEDKEFRCLRTTTEALPLDSVTFCKRSTKTFNVVYFNLKGWTRRK